MSKKYYTCLTLGAVLTLFSAADIILEALGISAFLFGRRIFPVGLAFAVAAAVICFTVFVFAALKYKKDLLSKKLTAAAKVVSVIFAVMILLVCFFAAGLLCESTVERDVASDGRHEISVTTDTLFGGWNITLYKRYTPFFKTEMQSFYVSDMVSEDEEITVVWYDDGCEVSYEYYSDYAETSESETYTQRLYFNKNDASE